MPKNEDHLKDGARLLSYLLLRALPAAVGLNLLFASLLASVPLPPALPPPAPSAPPPPPPPPPSLVPADSTLASAPPSCLPAASLGAAAASDQHVLVCQQARATLCTLPATLLHPACNPIAPCLQAHAPCLHAYCTLLASPARCLQPACPP